MIEVIKLLNRLWRLVATAISFTAFGIGGVLLWLLVFPSINIFIRSKKKRTFTARIVIAYSFQIFIFLMSFLGVLSYKIVGRERLQRSGLLILANHPSLIDTVFLMAFVKKADCIVKSGLWNNFFTRGPVRAAGYINNDESSALIEACIHSLKCGNNLLIFPEGTRTPASGEIKLKRGAANIAVRGQQNVTPVLIHCEPQTLSKGDPWWKIPERKVSFLIEIKEDISIDIFFKNANSEALAARHLTTYLQQYFIEGKTHHA